MRQPIASLAYVGPFPPIRGGISQHGGQLVKALERRGAQVRVVSWRSQYPSLLYPGTQVDVSPSPSIHFLRWWSVPSWIRSRRYVADCDYVIFPYVSPFHALPLRVILGGATGSKVAVVHNASPHERIPLHRLALKWLLTQVDGVIAHSASVASEIMDIDGNTRVSVVPLPPALDVTPAPLPEGPPRLLFFGYVRPYKGVDLLIRALAQLRRSGTQLELTVAGESWAGASELVRLSEELGVRDLVDFRFGYVRDDQVSDLLASHHLVIQPYRSASQSGVIPLAFAAGRGVVVTPVGGLSEVVEPYRNGVIATDVSAEALAAAIAIAIESASTLSAGALESTTTWGLLARSVLEVADGKVSPDR